MIFSDHDLFHNINGISQSQDDGLMKELVLSEIAKLIALHKKELVENIKSLGYILPDTKDKTIIDLIFIRTAEDAKLADMIGSMIVKYNKEKYSNIEEKTIGDIASGAGSLVGGIFGLISTSKQNKTAREIAAAQAEAAKANAEMQLQIETIRAGQQKGLSKGAWIAIIGGGAILLTIILVLALKKPKVIVQPTTV
jgi:outer membrane murein-binding lipoprotein Lpp